MLGVRGCEVLVLVLSSAIVMQLVLVRTLSGANEAHIVLFFSAGNFSASSGFPLVRGVWDLVLVQCTGVDHFVQTFAELNNGAFGRENPVGS